MSATDFLDIVIHIVFISLGALAIVDYLRRRNEIRRDVALMFGILAIPFLLQLIARIKGEEISAGAQILSVIALVLEPYLLLRLVRYLRSMPVYMMRLVGYSLIATIIMGILVGDRVPLITTLVSQGYLISFNLYAMAGFGRGVLRSTGVQRQRLAFAAAGSGLFALIFVATLLLNEFPLQKDFALLLVEALAGTCVITYYIGFAPPRWLRRMWQLTELRAYLLQTRHNRAPARFGVEENLLQLCQAVERAVGSRAVVIVKWDENTDQWHIRSETGFPVFSSVPLNDLNGLKQIWNKSRSQVIEASDTLNTDDGKLLELTGAHALIVVPVASDEQTWGLLLVFLQYPSLFIEDDLSLVELLAQQSTILLDNYRLIGELQTYSEELEQKNEDMKQRATQLEIVNKELESFSYSVSHDLRAPLRSIDGFSLIVLEDYSEQLPAEGRDYLERVRSAAQRMSQLIDDLLNLSRVSRAAFHPKNINLSFIVDSISKDLMEAQPNRPATFSITPDLMVNADPNLLQIVLENLLGNAWKFTSKQQNTLIEFGQQGQSAEQPFFIRDNGAGFDMAYANKLFEVFQRLHTVSEFPGTGVGLATVQRIIKIHGGRIWAEGEEGKGATFYFTL